MADPGPETGARPGPTGGGSILSALFERYLLLSPSERRAWRLLSVLAVVAAGVETLAGGLVYSSIAYLTDPSVADSSRVLGFLARRLPGEDPAGKSQAFLVLLGVFHVFRGAVQMWLAHWHLKLETETAYALACRLFDLYLAAPYSFHLRRHSAELRTHVFYDTTSVLSTLNAGVNLATQALTIAGLLAVVVRVSPWPSLFLSSVVCLILTLFLRFSREIESRWAEKQRQLAVAAHRHLQHGLGAIKELRITGREDFFSRAFRRDKLETLDITVRRHSMRSLPRLLIEALFGVGVLAALVLGGGATGSQIVPLLSLYAYVGIRAIPAAIAVAHEIGMVRSYVQTTIPVMEDLRALAPPPPATPLAPARGAVSVELRNVTFVYPGADRPALDDVSLKIGSGLMVGVVGASGAGKTTLGDVVLGLHTPLEGSIHVNGEEATAHVRSHLRPGYVPQTAFLFDDSVVGNIALGVDAADVREDRLRRAITSARLDGFVAALPRGLSTLLGEGGARCSGGERQRIAIARALYDDPDLIVLDEATSALDPATEKDILRSLESFRGKKTLLVISHRLSTVARCDHVLVLRAGRLVAQGTFDELQKSSPDFRAWAGLDDDGAPDAGDGEGSRGAGLP